jgi:SNF2 family DNA or RNA helicase
MLSRDNLHDYQNRAVDFILNKKRVFLMLEMGLGKTVSTLTAASDIIDSFAANRVLVIAPLRVANSVWFNEVNQWAHLEHLKVARATGSEKQRIGALTVSSDIVCINRENVKWLVEYYGKHWPFDFVVIDESSSFKNQSSQRFKALKKVIPYTEHMVLLTGTPSPNGLLDLWPQCYLIDQGEALGKTVTNYKKRFFESDYMGYSFTPRDGSDEKIHSLIKPYTLSMKAEDYLELPERIDSTINVTLPKKVVSDYRKFERELLAEIDGEEIEAVSAAALAGKLLQWCNGAIYTDEKGSWAKVHDEKIKALEELVDCNDEPMLVAYNFKSDLARIKKAFPDAVELDKSNETIAKWNRGEIKMLLAHPASAGHGLNLQKGGSLAVWFGLNWSLELYQQFNARLYRQGQTKPTRIIHIIATSDDNKSKFLDERVLEVLAAKDATQNELLYAMRP